jgi:maltooligosyltrehalose trehalohydrolase
MASVPDSKLAAALAVMLLAPSPPLLFMGEEWGSTQPFPFFCDFQGALADAVRRGRREEFRDAYAKMGDDIPDPLAKETFDSAVLDWSGSATRESRARLALVRDLLAIRRREIAPYLSTASFGSARHQNTVLAANWRLAGGRLLVLANLADEPAEQAFQLRWERAIWGGHPGRTLPPWSVLWGIGEA